MKRKQKRNQICLGLVLLVGLALWLGLALRFKAEDQLRFEPNVACLNGSPYGKVLVLVMQGSINVYFHQGSRHEDAEYLKEPSNKDSVAHNHSEHAHDEQGNCISSSDSASAGQEPERAVKVVPSVSLLSKAKRYIKTLKAYSHRRTDGVALTPAHKKYLQEVTEGKLRRAYQLDPSNYNNYLGLYLYLVVDDLGRHKNDPESAVALARRTLDYCKLEEVDPASWVTAATAAVDIGLYMGAHPESLTVRDVEAHLTELEYCLKRFEQLLVKAPENGFMVAPEALNLMLERAKQSHTQLRGQKISLRRVMAEKHADKNN